jgi:hypothetical protein
MESPRRKPLPGHAFISYVREDGLRVDRLQRALEAAGVRVWRDTADLLPGQEWRVEIRRAITYDSLAFIACFSSTAEKRQTAYQNEELILAIEQMRRLRPHQPWLIPVRFDACSLPKFDLGAGRTLDSLQRIDLFNDSWDVGVARLLSTVLRILEMTTESQLSHGTSRRQILVLTTTGMLSYAALGSSAARRPIGVPGAKSGLGGNPGSLTPVRISDDQRIIGGIAHIAFSRDGALFATGGDDASSGAIHLWQADTRQHLQILTGSVAPFEFSPDSQFLASATGDGHVCFWDTTDYSSTSSLPAADLVTLAFKPGTDIAFGGCRNGRLQTWDATTSTLMSETQAPHGIDTIVVNPAGHALTCGVQSDPTHRVLVWNADTAEILHSFTRLTRPTYLSPDGSILIAGGSADIESRPHTIEAWELAMERQIATLSDSVYFSEFAKFSFHPSGRMLAIGSGSEVHLWRIIRDPTVLRMELAAQPTRIEDQAVVLSLAFSSDGSTLAIGDNVGDVYLWDVRTLSS